MTDNPCHIQKIERRRKENMKNKEKPEILIPKGYRLDEMLDFEGDLWDEKPEFTEEVKIHFE